MDRRVALVIKRMQSELELEATTKQLATAVNLSSSRLNRLFKRDVGTSPGRYLRALRMARARVLLERTNLHVKDIMSSVGINDPSHFSRDFRRYHGVAPSEVREQHWADDCDDVTAGATKKGDHSSR